MPSLSAHRRSLTARFSSAAETYHDYALAQRAVAAHLLELVPPNLVPSTILELGCGSGQLTEGLCARFPESQTTAVDISKAMLNEARRRVNGDVTWTCADAATFSTTQPFDLVVSSSSLHWCDPLDAALKNLGTLTAPGGQLVVSLMADGTLRELRELRKKLTPQKTIAEMPLPDVVLQHLEDAGFEIEKTKDEWLPVEYPSAKEFFTSLRAQGLTSGHLARAEQGLTRIELARLVEAYQVEHGREDGTVIASFRPLYVRAKRTS